VLATSRSSLRINGEREYAVPPMELPPAATADPTPDTLPRYEAVRLFVQRALAVKADFELTTGNAPAVAEICERLDGLPLAIELAAARVKLLSPQAMLARMQNLGNLTLLTGGPRDLPSRQQALRNTIAWSYDLLNESEKTLFRRLSVFVGGCTLEVVEAIAGHGDVRSASGDPVTISSIFKTPFAGATPTLDLDILDGLTSLVDKSLVKAEGDDTHEPRFGMLETIREYANERLAESDEAEAMQARHAAYYLALCEEAEPDLRGPRQVELLDQLEREHDNLRAVLSVSLRRGDIESASRLAAALCWFWFAHGHLSEGRNWIATILDQAEGVPAQVRARLLAGAGRIANNQADYAGATRLLQEGLEIYRGLGDEQGVAANLNILGTVAIYSGEYAQAKAYYEESLGIFRKLEDRVGVSKCLANLGTVAFYSGDYAGARLFYNESLEAQRELGDMWGLAASLVNLGATALNQRDYMEAARCYKESLPLLYGLGDRASIAECLEGLAAAIGAWKGGQPERAARLFGAADALREAVGAPRSMASRPEYERNLKTARSLIHEVAFGEAWALGRAMSLEEALALAAEQVVSPSAYPRTELTSREIDVLRLVASGLTNEQVAEKLHLSRHTVHAHLTSIYSKLGTTTRAAATRYAVDNGLA
jgi:predicted ATPase/DNA-binding CsgD family transcriptional regulator